MQIHADLKQRALVLHQDGAWVPSPLPGVERYMLDRDGAEVARATSLVRYAPNSRFDAHTHGGGEEFLVLEGVFSDSSGDFGPGTYVRNPIGTSHAPWSDDGCTILVKLHQFHAADTTRVIVDTNSVYDRDWQQKGEGLSLLPLHSFKREQVSLFRFEPGAHVAKHEHDHGEEVFVLDGTLQDEHGTYPKGTWLRSPHGSAHTPYSDDGCLLFVKVGHLPST